MSPSSMAQFQTLITIGTILVAMIGGTLAVETRYARSADVKAQLDSYYARGLKTQIFQLQLKPAPLSAADKALLDHLQQELREATD